MKAMDTLATVKRLRAAGMNEEQAEALTSAIASSIEAGAATKADIKEATTDLERKIEAVKFDLERKIDTGLAGLGNRIDALESKIEVSAATLRSEMHQNMQSQTWRLLGGLTVIIGVFTALSKLV